VRPCPSGRGGRCHAHQAETPSRGHRHERCAPGPSSAVRDASASRLCGTPQPSNQPVLPDPTNPIEGRRFAPARLPRQRCGCPSATPAAITGGPRAPPTWAVRGWARVLLQGLAPLEAAVPAQFSLPSARIRIQIRRSSSRRSLRPALVRVRLSNRTVCKAGGYISIASPRGQRLASEPPGRSHGDGGGRGQPRHRGRPPRARQSLS